MHVLHLADSTVAGDYFRNIAAGLASRNIRVTLGQLAPGDAPTWLSHSDFVSLGARRKFDYPRAAKRLTAILRDRDVDILHTHLYYPGLIGVATRRWQRRTTVAMMRHHTSVVRMLGSNLHLAADRWMARNADHVTTVSEAAREYMREVDGIEREIEVVPIGFDFAKYAPNAEDRNRVRSEFGFAEGDFVIGYVANFIRGKGHIQLVAAFKTILASLPNARLIFAGGGMLSEVRDAAAEFPAGRIVFAGWRGDTPAFLNALDVFVQPSLSEAFSQVLVEAMGVEIPVVATAVGSADEVIESGVIGILVAPDDPAAIASAVIGLYRDPVRRQRIARAGAAAVRSRYTLDRMIDRHVELYERWLR